MQADEHLLAIDLGTTKVCAVIARVIAGDDLEVIGIGTHPSEGMQNGAVIDLERTTRSIEAAAQKALATAGVEVSRAWVGIAASFIQSYNSRGSVAVLQGQRGITKADMKSAIRAAVDMKIPPEMQVLHVIPRGFRVDDRTGVRDPEGMVGNLLEVDVHLVCGRKNDIANIERAAQAAGFRIEGVILQPIASSMSVLSPAEMMAGVAMVDIGGGTTDIAIYKDGHILQSKIVLIGGDLITRDIAAYFAAPVEHAEALKRSFGWALTQPADEAETIEVQRIRPRPPRQVPRSDLNFVIEARVEQIIQQVERTIDQALPREDLVAGIVLTGGSSLLGGLAEKFQKELGVDTGLGIPGGVTGFTDIVKSPTCATAIGMLQYALKERRRLQAEVGRGIPKVVRRFTNFLSKYF
ncbi:MAG: cell division protein FtsA [Candidatus Omnitrophica bacterium]|nr:cell division protein FtsA [Candidatus Omnitrophota bacterium]